MNNPSCPSCQQSIFVIKHGHNHSGSQRYRCQHCQRYFTPSPNPEGYATALHQEAVKLYLAGLSFRKIGKHLGVHHQSVRNWVAAAATQLPETEPAPELAPTSTIEVDELFTFVGSKKQKSMSSRPSPAKPA